MKGIYPSFYLAYILHLPVTYIFLDEISFSDFLHGNKYYNAVYVATQYGTYTHNFFYASNLSKVTHFYYLPCSMYMHLGLVAIILLMHKKAFYHS